MIGMFENYLVYGRVVSVPRPIVKKFDYTIEWDMSRLPDGFPIAQYHFFTSVVITNALKLHLQMDIKKASTCNDAFTEPRS